MVNLQPILDAKKEVMEHLLNLQHRKICGGAELHEIINEWNDEYHGILL